MTQEAKAMPDKQAQQKPAAKDDEIAEIEEEIAELEIPTNTGVSDIIEMFVEKLACNRLGQMILGQCDRVLKIVEDTAKWGLPQDENDAKLERPLPWVLFLSLIIWLRVVYFWLNIGSTIVGSSRITPQTTVYAIQTKRRHLRAIRLAALKSTKRRDQEPATTSGSSAKSPSIMSKVTKLFGRAVCRPGQLRDEPPTRPAFAQSECLNMNESEISTERCTTKRPRDEECADLYLTVDEMLNKYTNEVDSEDDSDYVPNVEDDDDDNASTSSSSMSSDEETEKGSVENIPTLCQVTSDNSNNYDESISEVQENGGPNHHRPIPQILLDVKHEPLSDIDSGSEQVQTPHVPLEETTEVAAPKGIQTQFDTPPQQQQQQHNLTAKLDEVLGEKATPGHATAASVKPDLYATNEAAKKPQRSKSESKDIPKSRSKCCTTITTETCIEYDWSIVIKTEISHKRRPGRLQKLDCSVQTLTPASSSEDIFYSPIGSPPDFHSIFHHAPLINNLSPEEHPTQSREATNVEANMIPSPEENPEWNAIYQRKPNQMKANKQQQHQPNYYNNKYRNKNRR